MKTIIINPGTEPISDTNEESAVSNTQAFVDELNLDGISVFRMPGFDYGNGRYAFNLIYNERACPIQMPGLPLNKVAYHGGDNPWHFPRLYVDGSSWLWEFALSSARRILTGEEDS